MSRISCHDPQVFKSISRGIGYRLRITNSENETFKENVEFCSRALATSGYDFQAVKKELNSFTHIDPKELIKSDKKKTKKSTPGCKVYFNTTYDPRVMHPRKIISKNYKILAGSEVAKKTVP